MLNHHSVGIQKLFQNTVQPLSSLEWLNVLASKYACEDHGKICTKLETHVTDIFTAISHRVHPATTVCVLAVKFLF